MSNKQGVLLVNLGSPESTDPKDVKVYLREFLMDEHVIDVPYWKRWLLIEGIILNTRPKKSAAAYQKIWWKEGSPLIVLSQRVFEKVRKKVDKPMGLAMRYGKMSIEKGLTDLFTNNPELEGVKLIPLYPHYAKASTHSVIEKAEQIMKEKFPSKKMTYLQSFYNEENYINAQSKQLGNYLEEDYDHLLFSYHGIPERHLTKLDPTGKHCLKCDNCCEVKSEAHKVCYRHQVFETTRLIVEKLEIPKEKYSVSFQSRLAGTPWLTPYTDFEIERLAKEGKKRIVLISPAFVSDCLETLEELGMEGEEDFLKAGGEKYTLVPCLNEQEAWVDTLAGYCS
ncbi:MAG: ferrochelatase [Flavobacteriales bacterium]|jgi:ferrochelatase